MTNYRIISDPVYGYLRIEPIPTQEEVEKYYSEEFYSGKYKQFNDSSLEVQQKEQDFFDSRWESLCKVAQQHFGGLKGLSVFDIGFGYAQALLYFRRKGMLCSGLEPSPDGVSYAKFCGLEVVHAGIGDFSWHKGEKYDMVTLLNVLEHLRDPALTLSIIREKLLSPGGLLVIDVPNEFNDFQTVANEEFDLRQWWVCPPVHINYFSASSLSSLVQKCGYKVVYKEASFPLEMFLLMGDVYVNNSEIGSQCHRRRVMFEQTMLKHGKGEKLRRYYNALAELDLGRQITLYVTY